MTVLEQLIDSPWNGDDLLPPLSDQDRASIRTALLAQLAAGDLKSGVPAALGWFPDAEVLAALQQVLTRTVTRDVSEAAAESIGKLAATIPAAQAALRELLASPESGIVRVAVENVDDPAILLPLVDTLAAYGDDTMMSAVVERLAEDPTTPVIQALARHWDFVIRHGKTGSTSNKIFDTLIDHAPRSVEAQAVFAAAVAHEAEYGQVRGLAALALTSDEITPHVKKLKAMKGLKPSGSSLRTSALAKLVKTRKPDLERLAAAGDKTAAGLLK